jgi:hypothetical protein
LRLHDIGAVTVTVNGDQPPTVSLISPANGAAYVAPATVTLSASASDPAGTVSSVSFYAGAQLIGSANGAMSPWAAIH